MTITERIDNITRIPPEYRTPAPPVPKSVKIELTARCDFQCFFCATGYKLRDRMDMDFDLYCRLITEMREAGVEELGVFYLGESFLYKRLAEAISFAKHEVGFPYVFLTTNGRLATAERTRECFEAGLNSLKFSYNWANPEQCKEITRVDAFDTVTQNIKDAKAMRDQVEAATGHRCGLYASSIHYDGEQHELMKEAVAEIEPYVDQHYWLPLYGQAGLTAGVKGTTPVAGNIGRSGNIQDPLPCWSIFTEGHVTFDGKLAACCFDHDGRFEMGDLTQTPFIEAWGSQPFQALRDANLKEDVRGTACETCVAYQDHEIDAPRAPNLASAS